MKKIKWILPLTLFGGAVVVVPSISSCSNEWSGAIDLTHDVKYKYEKLQGEGKDVQKPMNYLKMHY